MCFNISFSYAANKVIVATRELPLELRVLIDSLQQKNPEAFNNILPTIFKIDQYAKSMNKEDLFLITKVEIYKTLLKNYEVPIKQPIDGSGLQLLREGYRKVNDPFSRWFLQALIKDTKDLLESPNYKEYILQKNNGLRSDKIEYRKLEKKSELIQRWVSKIRPQAEDFPASLTNELIIKMKEALNNIEERFALIHREASQEVLAEFPKDENALKFFKVEIAKSLPANIEAPKEGKSVEEILSPLTDSLNPANLPTPSQENWLEEENTPPELKNLPKPSNDADWLEDF